VFPTTPAPCSLLVTDQWTQSDTWHVFSVWSAPRNSRTMGFMQSASRQRLSKHISAYRTVLCKAVMSLTIQTVFSMGSVPLLYSECLFISLISTKSRTTETRSDWREKWRTESSLIKIQEVGSPRWLNKKWQEYFIVIWSASFCVEIRY
jgi:hypothetical protein